MKQRITCVLTDIEGSTRLKTSSSLAYEDALADYFKFVDNITQSLQGKRHLDRGEGDSMFITFKNAQAGVEFAARLQSRSSQAPFGTITLSTRIGIHTLDLEDFDRDPFGEGPYYASRLRNAGSGGQTIVSSSTFSESRETPEFKFRPLGAHRVRSFEKTAEHLWLLQPLVAQELSLEIRTLTTVPNNLLEFGYRGDFPWEEADQLAERWAKERLMIATATPLSGHREVLLKVASVALPYFAGGLFVCESLDLEQISSFLTTQAVLSEGSVGLCCLAPARLDDNASSAIHAFLHSHPTVHLWLTSNKYSSKLKANIISIDKLAGVQRMREQAILGLKEVPPQDFLFEEVIAVQQLQETFGFNQALQMIREKDANSSYLELGLEVHQNAQAWIQPLPEPCFSVLAALHQAKTALTQLEIEFLLAETSDEKFTGLLPTLLELVDTQCIHTAESPDGIRCYRAGSLLHHVAHPDGGPARDTRLRELCRADVNAHFEQGEHLPGAYSEAQVFCATRWSPLLRQRVQDELAIGTDEQSLISFTHPFIIAGRYDDLLWLCNHMLESGKASDSNFWLYSRSIGELRLQQFEIALQTLNLCVPEPESLLRACVSNSRGLAHFHLGDLNHSIQDLSAAKELFEKLRSDVWVAKALNNLGRVALVRLQYDEAMDYFQEALFIRERIGDKRGMAECENNMGAIYGTRQDISKAIPHYQRAVELYRSTGQAPQCAIVLSNLAFLTMEEGNYTLAKKFVHEGTALSTQFNLQADKIIFRTYELLMSGTLGTDEFQRDMSIVFDAALSTGDQDVIHDAALAACRGLIALGKVEAAGLLARYIGLNAQEIGLDPSQMQSAEVGITTEQARRVARGFVQGILPAKGPRLVT